MNSKLSDRHECDLTIYRNMIKTLETKYLGEETRHIEKDKYFRMLYNGMTETEAKNYTKAKMMLMRRYHGII